MMVRRIITVLLEVAAGLLLVAGLSVGLLLGRLSQGPMNVDFIIPTLTRILDSELPVKIEVAHAILAWDGSGEPLDVRALGVRTRSPAGDMVASLPELRVGFSLPGLLLGRLAPTRIVLVQPSLSVTEDAEGHLAFAISSGDGDSGGTGKLVADLADALRRPPDPTDPLRALREVRIIGARLAITSQQYKLSWVAPRADLSLLRGEGGLTGHLSADIAFGQALHRVEANLQWRSADGVLTADAKFQDLPVADLALISPLLAPLARASLAVSGHASVEVAPDLTLSGLVLDFKGGPGTLAAPDDQLTQPLDVKLLEVKARIDRGGSRAQLEKFALDLNGPKLSVSANAERQDGTWSIRAGGALEALPVSDLARYWPAGVLPNPRRWMTANLADGAFDRVSFGFEGTAPDADLTRLATTTASADFAFSGASINYMAGLPLIKGAAGTAKYLGPELTIAITDGRLLELQVLPADIRIYGLEDEGTDLIDIKVPVKGPLSSALAVIDSPPLRYASKVNIKPENVGGEANLVLSFAFPLVADLKMDEVTLRAEGNLTGVSAPKIVAGIDATEGEMKLVVTNNGLSLTGPAKLNQVPALVTWEEDFVDSAEIYTKVAVQATADNPQRSAFGIELPDYVQGPVALDLLYTRDRARVETMTGQVDLTPAELRIELLDWKKKPGEVGTANLQIAFENGRPIHFRRFAIRTPELQTSGTLELKPEDLSFARMHLADFTLKDSDLTLDFEAAPNDGLKAQARGKSLDARALRRGLKGPPGGASPEEAPKSPFAVTFDIEKVLMGDEGQVLLDVKGSAERPDQQWERAILDAKVSETGTLKIRYWPEDSSLLLAAESDDAGAALRQLGLIDHLQHGTLAVTGRSDPKDPQRTVSGVLDMRNYQVVNAPGVARLLSAMGPRGFARFMGGAPIAFDRLDGEFRWHSQGVSFHEVRSSGSAIGLTMEGNVDVVQDAAELQGTIVPVSDVNRLLGSLPLVGELFLGGEDGLFAATYKVKGPLDNLDISVNPLAALAPGFLRRLFFQSAPPAGPKEAPKESQKENK